MERTPGVDKQAEPVIVRYEDLIEPISNVERQIGGIIHAVLNENLPIEEAEVRIKMIAELNAPSDSAEDR